MFKKSIAGLAIVLMLLVTAAVAVDNPKPDTPSSAPGATIIDVDQGKRLLDNRSAAVFDMRNPLNFGKGHLPGATLMAYRERSTFQPDFDATKDKVDLSKLPADKNARIVLYSDGPKGCLAPNPLCPCRGAQAQSGSGPRAVRDRPDPR